MTHRSWPVLLPLLLAAVAGQSSLRAQSAEPQALLLPMPQELPRHASVPDVRLPGSVGSVALGALRASDPDPAPPPLAYPLDQPAESLDPWGWRYSERRSAWRLHTGIDLAARQGTAVLASRAGRVLLVEDDEINRLVAGKLLEMFGNLASGRELGMLTTEGFGPWIIFEFADTGYVKDDEKDELDADSLLKTLREGQAYGNERRREMGLEELELVGWAVPPKYNIETNNLEWGTIVRSASGGDSVNYNTRLLGRRGVMEVALVCSPDELQALLPQYQSILAGYDYIDGERYAEFRQGDRMAQYGLTALVAGGAAVAASKMGLFAKFGAFFAKLGKGAILLVVAAGVGLKKLLGKLLGARQDPTQP
jgi:uncharacterized membrane-anchored protein